MRSDETHDSGVARGLDLEMEEFLEDELSEGDREAIGQWRNMANVWHDEVVPAWRPPQIAGQRGWQVSAWNLQSWFPTLASATALVLVAVMFFQQPTAPIPTAQPAGTDLSALPPLPQATQAAMVESVLESSRDERQQELQAIIRILKAHMDKRALETEESLRYVISHQLQGQQELEDLYRQVEDLMREPAPGEATR